MTQQDSFGAGRPGPLPPPPPNYPPGQYRQDGEPPLHEHPVYEPFYEPFAYQPAAYQPPPYQGYPQYDPPVQGWAPTAPAGYGYPAPRKTNVMAVLGLVFAFLFAPLGAVFSAIGLGQTRRRGEKGRGLALAGLIVAVVAVVLEVLVIVLAVAAAEREVHATAASHSAAQSAPQAPAGDSATTEGTAGAPGLTGSDPQGVLSACRVILPALLDLATDLQDVSTPDEYAQALAALEKTLSGATALTSDPGFAADVARLDADLSRAAATVQAGQDPSGLADALQADGTSVGADCSTAGYSQ